MIEPTNIDYCRKPLVASVSGIPARDGGMKKQEDSEHEPREPEGRKLKGESIDCLV